jgi:hypothetical protein
MRTHDHSSLIEALPVTLETKELMLFAQTEVLDDIIDFLNIRFPNWNEELGHWAAEFLLSNVYFYKDLYSKETKCGTSCLTDVYRDIQDSYLQFVKENHFVGSVIDNDFDD